MMLNVPEIVPQSSYDYCPWLGILRTVLNTLLDYYIYGRGKGIVYLLCESSKTSKRLRFLSLCTTSWLSTATIAVSEFILDVELAEISSVASWLELSCCNWIGRKSTNKVITKPLPMGGQGSRLRYLVCMSCHFHATYNMLSEL